MLWAIILPLGSLIAVVTVMLSLGTVFTLAGNLGTSIIGMAIIAIVPAIGFALTRGSNSRVHGSRGVRRLEPLAPA